MSVETCACTAEDYECDIGFTRDKSGECVPIVPLAANPPPECASYYSVSSGYRKVAGDMCEGGV